MSILNFLSIASGGGDRPRPRKLAVESLERRAVMTVLDPLLSNATVETAVQPPVEVAVPIVETVETLAEPVTTDAPPPLLEDPAVEDPLPIEEPEGGDGGGAGGEDPEETAPVITESDYTRNGLWVTITGFVQDDGPVAGLTIYFSSDLGQQFTTTVDADGSFHTHMVLVDIGAQLSFYTIDVDGNYSEYRLLIV